MTLALRKGSLVKSLISVDNAPVDATLKGDFLKYVEGLKEVEAASIYKQTDADVILKKFEDVCGLQSPRLDRRWSNTVSSGSL